MASETGFAGCVNPAYGGASSDQQWNPPVRQGTTGSSGLTSPSVYPIQYCSGNTHIFACKHERTCLCGQAERNLLVDSGL
jgi:hypothetical protein